MRTLRTLGILLALLFIFLGAGGLLTTPSRAQALSAGGGGGACAVDVTGLNFASYYRATTLTGTVPGYSCDGILERCIDLGPGARTSLGVNPDGDICIGPCSGTGTVVRVFGTIISLVATLTNATVSNVLTVTAAIDLGTAGFIRNPNAGQPVRVTDMEGLRLTPVTALQPCTSATLDGTLAFLAPSAGAGTGLKACVCESDYAATPTFRWKNVQTGQRGTTTTDCP